MLSKFFALLAVPLTIPLFVLNIASLPVAGVALAIDGQWSIILYGVGALFLIPFAYAFLMLPNMGLVLAAGWFFERKGVAKVISLPTAILAIGLGLLLNTLINFSIVGGVFFLLPILGGQLDWAVLLWCYAIATGPFTYMASKEDQENVGMFIVLFFVQILAALYFIIPVVGQPMEMLPKVGSIWILVSVLVQAAIAIEMGAAGIRQPRVNQINEID